MQKWEYLSGSGSYDEEKKTWVFKCLEQSYEKTDAMLNAIGEEGWELVGVSPYVSTVFTSAGASFVSTNEEYFYFKRPKE